VWTTDPLSNQPDLPVPEPAMRLSAISTAILAVTLAALPALGHAVGTDEPKPAPKPEPKPQPKPDPKDAPKAAPAALQDADYVAGKTAVDARDWKRAIELFTRAAARDADNANIQNYLGFANRNDGNWEVAMKHYRTALALNPEHRGATEYMGHAYLLRGNLQLAQGQLTRLERICGRGCDEYASLSKAIEDFRRNPK
jgi:tetratricopeptide (TPR) repeat protein